LGRTELRWAELMAFGVGEEAVEGAHDVAHVEGDGGDWIRVGGGAGVEGIVREGLDQCSMSSRASSRAWTTARITAGRSVWVPRSQGSMNDRVHGGEKQRSAFSVQKSGETEGCRVQGAGSGPANRWLRWLIPVSEGEGRLSCRIRKNGKLWRERKRIWRKANRSRRRRGSLCGKRSTTCGRACMGRGLRSRRLRLG
jgi:hypothetical protein